MIADEGNVVHFPDQMQRELFMLHDEILHFAIVRFNDTLLKKTEMLISDFNVSEELSEKIFPQLVWWIIFCSPFERGKPSIYQQFLQENKERLEKERVAAREILVSWLFLNPSFCYVKNIKSKSGRVFIFKDIFEKQIKIVGIYNKTFQTPQEGELIIGLLLPMGSGIYTTQGGLFHVPVPIVSKIVHALTQFYRNHSISPSYHLNPQCFPSMIKLTLRMIGKTRAEK